MPKITKGKLPTTDLLTLFGTAATPKLDAMKPGDKLDRKQFVQAIRLEAGITAHHMTEMDGLTLLSVLLRGRGDFEVIKGPQGGTIKK